MASGLEEQLGEYFDEVYMYDTIIASRASHASNVMYEYDEQGEGDNNTLTALETLSSEPHTGLMANESE
jgi:hypothetical protein